MAATMKMYGVLFSLSVLVVLGCSSRQSGTSDDRSGAAAGSGEQTVMSLRAVPEVIDLGDQHVGLVRAFSAKIVKGSSNAPVQVKAVQPSCGCTNVKVAYGNADSNELASITGEVRLPTTSGPFREKITIFDSNNNQLVVEIRAEVMPNVTSSRNDFVFDEQRKVLTANITNKTENVLRLEKPIVPDQRISATLSQLELKAGESAVLTVSVAVDAQSANEFIGDVSIQTSDTVHQRLSYKITFRGSQTVQVLPPTIELGAITSGEEVECRVRLYRDKLSPEQVSVGRKPSFVAIDQVKSSAQGIVDIKLKIKVPQGKIKLAEVLELIIAPAQKQADHQEFRLEVPISGLISK